MNSNRPLVYLTGIVSAMFLLVSPESGAQSAAGERPLFGSHEILDVRIEAPMTTLMKERPEEEYLGGKFAYVDDSGQAYEFDLKLRTRGKFRRKKGTCKFAPIRLNFPTKQLEGSDFAGQDKLKLITHCESKRSRYEQLVLREYLTYRILQTLTDKSFGARLMHITYVDTDGKEPLTRYGFVIEDEDDIGTRLGLEKLDSSGLNYRDLDAPHTNLISMYQYLIGNTDYSLIRGPVENDCCHNAIPYSDGRISRSIPYDFDHAGMVNAPYATPSPQLKIRSVRTRVYRGRCSNNEILPDTLAFILSKQADIFALVNELEDLDKKNRQEVTRYLNAFFDDITDPKKIQRNLIRKCS